MSRSSLTEDDPPDWPEILAQLAKRKIPTDGIEFVRRAVIAPQREVTNNIGPNVTSFRYHEKSRCLIQAEASTTERAWVWELAYAEWCWRFYDQPPTVHVATTRADGSHHRRPYTADYVSIEAKEVCVYENKPSDKLEEWITDPESGWTKVDGEYRNDALAELFRRMGLVFKVRTEIHVTQVRAENLQLLLHARRRNSGYPQPWYIKKVRAHLRTKLCVTLADLADASGSADVTPLLLLIDDGVIATNLDSSRLSLAESCFVALSQETVDAMSRGNDAVQQLVGDLGVDAAKAPSPREIVRIGRRLEELKKAEHVAALEAEGDTVKLLAAEKPTKCARTLQTYRKTLEQFGAAGLRSGLSRSGLRGSQLHPAHDRLISRVGLSGLGRKLRKTVAQVHKSYRSHFERRHAKKKRGFEDYPVVINTFKARMRRINHAKLAWLRGGRRLANAAAHPTDPTKRSLPARRPFQRAHLDHYKCNLFAFVVSSGGRSFALRPWVTFLIDEATTELLAFSITLGAPSRRTIGRVLRDCVRKWKRLPESIITDAGSEFRSVFMRDLMGRLMIEKFQRPVANGRWGQEVEGAFKTYQETFLGFLNGTLKTIEDRRSVSSAYQPEHQAHLTLQQLYKYTDEFIQWFNQHVRGLTPDAPSVLMAEGLKRYPCSGYAQEMTEAFLVNTSVPASNKQYEIHLPKGIHTQNQFYWADALAGIGKKHVNGVLHDCEDDSLIYCALGGTWHALRSRSWNKHTGSSLLSTVVRSMRQQEMDETVEEARLIKDRAHGAFLAELTKSARAAATDVPTKDPEPCPEKTPAPRMPPFKDTDLPDLEFES